jgi:regulatory protein
MERGGAESQEKRKKGLEPRPYLLWLLARRDYSRSQLEEKLKARGVAESEIEALLQALVDEGLFKEEAFVRSRARVLAGRGLSKNWVRSKLRAERVEVPRELVAEVFEELGIDESNQARDLADKHARRLLRRDPRLKDLKAFTQKLLQALMTRGHAYALAKKIVDAKVAELKGGL